MIGTRGATIKDIQHRTGAMLEVEKGGFPHQHHQSSSSSTSSADLKQITISGTPDQIEAAKAEINRIIGTTAGIREYQDNEFAGNSSAMNQGIQYGMQPGMQPGMYNFNAMFNGSMDLETMTKMWETQGLMGAMMGGMMPPMQPPMQPTPSQTQTSLPPSYQQPSHGDEDDFPPPGLAETA